MEWECYYRSKADYDWISLASVLSLGTVLSWGNSV